MVEKKVWTPEEKIIDTDKRTIILLKKHREWRIKLDKD